jgi:hypothetical protein
MQVGTTMTADPILDELHHFRELFADRRHHDMETMMSAIRDFAKSMSQTVMAGSYA